jgi:Na+/H+ antiporter
VAGLILLLVLVTATVVLAPLAERISVPYPVVLLIFGLLLAFIPGLPVPEINPDLILPLILPPLLFAAARRTSWREFLDNLRAIGLLAVALVVVTAFAVGAALHALVPGLPLMAAFALGAAVAPPDPVTATAVARKLPLPHRLRTILVGEGMFNDATALVLYQVAVAATVTGAFSPWYAAQTFGLAVVVGLAVGLVIAMVTRWLLGKLPPHPAGSALVLIMPFAAYAAADAAHGSGVLAVLTVALTLSRYADPGSSQTRLFSGISWEIVELLLTGTAFAFIGLNLRFAAHSVGAPLDTLLGQGVLITAVVIGVRFLWIFSIAGIDERVRRRRRRHIAEPIGWREMLVSSWAGMRGVVTLAAALALPSGFPQRERLIFIAFVVTIITVVAQGLTLPPLVKTLGVTASEDDRAQVEQDLIRRAREAGFRRLDQLRRRGDIDDDVIDHAKENADRMWNSLGFDPSDDGAEPNNQHSAVTVNALKDELLAAAREAVVDARAEPGSDPTIVDQVLRRLDARGTRPS